MPSELLRCSIPASDEGVGPSWIVCQIGAREHYSIARTLHSDDNLALLATDIWAPGLPFASNLPKRMRNRFHPDLAEAQVFSPSLRTLFSELSLRMRAGAREAEFLRMNDLFQERVLGMLRNFDLSGTPKILFSYSYAAKKLFRYAKSRGWRTVLGQIDPGPKEERVVAQLASLAVGQSDWQPAPPAYWQSWRDEVQLADRILVNSDWSRTALVEEGVPFEKISILPLVYSPSHATQIFQRGYPKKFDTDRPLRVLFLGQLNLRKGALLVFDVCRALRHLPVEFHLVGPEQVMRPDDVATLPNVRWAGAVPRDEVDAYYRQADVFLFPTFSDGFGLTQLEAQSWKLPVIASRYCGEVVADGVNGRLLRDDYADEIVRLLTGFLHDPGQLRDMSVNAHVAPQHGFATLKNHLRSIGLELASG